MLDVVDDICITGDDAAEGGKRLGEGAHNQIYFVGQAKVGRGAVSFAEHAQAVGIVHHKPGAVSLAELNDLRERGDVTFHTVDAIDDDHDTIGILHALQNVLQVVHIVVAKALHRAPGELAAVHDAGMVFLVGDGNVSLAHQNWNGTQVCLVTSAEAKSRLFADKLGQPAVQFVVDSQGPVEETRTGTTRAILFNRFHSRLAHFGMGGQAQVVVRPDHHQFLVAHLHDVAFGVVQRLEVRIVATPLSLFGHGHSGIGIAFFEEIHVFASASECEVQPYKLIFFLCLMARIRIVFFRLEVKPYPQADGR